MPSVEAAIEARAVATGGLAALIGTAPTRLYPVEAAQGSTLPYVTYQVVSAPRLHVMNADKDGQYRIQMDIWASTWTNARLVRDQLLVAFDRWSGVSGGTTVDASVCENDGIQVQPEDTTRIPRLTMEFMMTVKLA